MTSTSNSAAGPCVSPGGLAKHHRKAPSRLRLLGLSFLTFVTLIAIQSGPAQAMQSSDPSTWPTCTGGPYNGFTPAPGPPSDMAIPHCRAVPTQTLPRGEYVTNQVPTPSVTGHIFDGASGYTASGSLYEVYGNLESVVSTLDSGATQFATNWYMVNDYNQPANCPGLGGNLIQVGWAQTSFDNPNDPEVFEFDSVRCQWDFFGQYGIGQDSLVPYAVASPDQTTTWDVYIYWNNSWNLLMSATMPWADAPVGEEQQEAYNDTATVPDPSIPEHENTGTEVFINPSGFQSWTSSVMQTSVYDQSPYCVNFYSPYYGWAVGNTCSG